MEGIAYGGDYNPEQWPASVRLEDLELMKEAGVNFLSVGIFSWALLEPAEGDIRLRLAGRGAGQPRRASASRWPWPRPRPLRRPGWSASIRKSCRSRLTGPCWDRAHGGTTRRRRPFTAATPPASPASSPNGTRTTPRWRCGMWTTNWAATSPSSTARRTPRRSARGWNGATAASSALNAAWGTAFWSQNYGSFEEILPPAVAPSTLNPGQQLDFQRFNSWALMDYYRELVAVLREVTPGGPLHHQPDGLQRHQIHGLLRLGQGPGRHRQRPLPGGRRSRAAHRTRVQRGPHPGNCGRRPVDPDGTFDVGRQLAAAQPAQDARRNAAQLAGARGPRRGRGDVLPVAAELCRVREIPLGHGPARRPGHPGVARGGGAGVCAEAARAGPRFPGGIPGWPSCSITRPGGPAKSTPSRART